VFCFVFLRKKNVNIVLPSRLFNNHAVNMCGGGKWKRL